MPPRQKPRCAPRAGWPDCWGRHAQPPLATRGWHFIAPPTLTRGRPPALQSCHPAPRPTSRPPRQCPRQRPHQPTLQRMPRTASGTGCCWATPACACCAGCCTPWRDRLAARQLQPAGDLPIHAQARPQAQAFQRQIRPAHAGGRSAAADAAAPGGEQHQPRHCAARTGRHGAHREPARNAHAGSARNAGAAYGRRRRRLRLANHRRRQHPAWP